MLVASLKNFMIQMSTVGLQCKFSEWQNGMLILLLHRVRLDERLDVLAMQNRVFRERLYRRRSNCFLATL